MLMREKIRELLTDAAQKSGLARGLVFEVSYATDNKFGDYASNIAMVGAKALKSKPKELAEKIIANLDSSVFEKVEVAGPGFINFTLKLSELQPITYNLQSKSKGKILLEYFQPNIAKPLHIGHLETAIIGDCLKRMFLYLGYKVESDTHMGDWGTQFGYLILAQKKFDKVNDKIYAELNADESQREAAKLEFVKLEQGDPENRKIWQQLVDTSVKEFLQINDLMDILPFDHHWPESFYEDKMSAVLEELKKKKLIVESQGAQIVNLEEQGLGVAIIVKSDGGTTYLLRDLAGFLFVQKEGFKQHLYVVDNRQSLHYKQLFAILKLIGKIEDEEGIHVDYGFISFKGEALSTRKGNMVLAEDVITQAEEKVAKIVSEKNPDLKDKQAVIKAVTKGALKYFILKHNRHSDIEFDWVEVLDFEGDTGPYLQYAYARLASILRRVIPDSIRNQDDRILNQVQDDNKISATERELLFKLSILPEIVEDALKDYMPNILANYLYKLATLINKFYHESPVVQEKDEAKKNFRLALILKAQTTLGQGMSLLGIHALEEM